MQKKFVGRDPLRLPSSIFTHLFLGWAMCQYLPPGEFQIIPLSEVDITEIIATPADASHGYFLEVDLSYPEHLHDYLDEFPPGPEKKAPQTLSPFQREMLAEEIRAHHPHLSPEAVEAKVDGKKPAKKLIASLEKKTNHICHYRLLQKYLELGMTLDRVRRVIKFKQAPWMQPYIEMNSQLRKEAKSDFERDFFKLMNNRYVSSRAARCASSILSTYSCIN